MNVIVAIVGMTSIGLMGFANQRGPICTVGAIREIVTEHRFVRFAALMEAALWVGGGLVVLDGLGLLPRVPHGYRMGAATVAGGAVFGLGSFINGTCAIGTIARIGARHWSYLATLVGFALGSMVMGWQVAPEQLDDRSVVLMASAWLMSTCIVLLVARLLMHGQSIWRASVQPMPSVWSPYVATTVMGLSFLVVLVTVGSWSYTDTLAALVRGTAFDWALSLLLFTALFVGALIGGWTTDMSGSGLPKGAPAWRCLIGGILMGAGAALVPGGNDSLLLVGMPLLLPYAWIAFASMSVTIYIATVIAWHGRRQAPNASAH